MSAVRKVAISSLTLIEFGDFFTLGACFVILLRSNHFGTIRINGNEWNERKGKERKGKERKGKERKGKERKERKGKERK